MAIERRAQAVWEGDLVSGNGRVSGGSGALADLAVTWTSRTEQPDGRTSPEELVAAAHAACYAMALSNTLANAGTPAEELRVEAVVSADLGEDGLAVTDSEISVSGRVPGLDPAEFERAAAEADRGCPISNALRGNLDVRVRTSPRG